MPLWRQPLLHPLLCLWWNSPQFPAEVLHGKLEGAWISLLFSGSAKPMVQVPSLQWAKNEHLRWEKGQGNSPEDTTVLAQFGPSWTAPSEWQGKWLGHLTLQCPVQASLAPCALFWLAPVTWRFDQADLGRGRCEGSETWCHVMWGQLAETGLCLAVQKPEMTGLREDMSAVFKSMRDCHGDDRLLCSL